MARFGIREVDAKRMYFESIGKQYSGIQVKSLEDISLLENNKKYVVKPDMLFGKRGKYGLVWVKLEKQEVKSWLKEKLHTSFTLKWVEGKLEVCMVEDFVPHKEEYYVSFDATRDWDIVYFSTEWGIDIEENWEKVQNVLIAPDKNLSEEHFAHFHITDEKIKETLSSLWKYFREYGFVYLEVNPFCFHSETGELVLLDMVAKVDDQEFFRQKHHWWDLEIPNYYGFSENAREAYIRELDQQTGASLKFKVLNENARIWTLLAGWGGSLVMTDSLGALGYADDIGNYWELSGNPNREFTREYVSTLLSQMLENKIPNKYLVIAGAIANFTDIKTTFTGIIDAFEIHKWEILKQNLQILVRRWWINEKAWLEYFRESCEKLGIKCKIADSSVYMTDILKEIKL